MFPLPVDTKTSIDNVSYAQHTGHIAAEDDNYARIISAVSPTVPQPYLSFGKWSSTPLRKV